MPRSRHGFLTKYFLLGAIGGVAPEALRLYSLAKEGQHFRFSAFYVAMSIVFALLAGLVAVLLPSPNERAAFYAGISTPVLINTVAKKVQRPRRKQLKEAGARSAESPRSRFDAFIDAL